MVRIWAQQVFGSDNALRDFAVKSNYLLGRYRREVIWIVGDGRDGTTWLSSVINWHGRYREMFEPFQPEFVPEMRSLRPYQYIRVGSITGEFRELANIVFCGRLHHERLDAQTSRRLHHGLVVKDIFAHLFAAAVLHEFPVIKLVLITRNPIDVALSKLKLRKWWWPHDLELFLAQQPLMRDYLYPFETQIANCSDDFVARQVLVWAALHYVLLRQRSQYRAHIVFYECLRHSPQRELRRLFQFLHGRSVDNATSPGLLKAVSRPSRMTRTAGVDAHSQVTSEQLGAIADILTMFGLDQLYDSDRMPTQGRRNTSRARPSVNNLADTATRAASELNVTCFFQLRMQSYTLTTPSTRSCCRCRATLKSHSKAIAVSARAITEI
jgi:Sulfotransferase domain